MKYIVAETARSQRVERLGMLVDQHLEIAERAEAREQGFRADAVRYERQGNVGSAAARLRAEEMEDRAESARAEEARLHERQLEVQGAANVRRRTERLVSRRLRWS
ncbi:hypothetical protein HCZ23_10705 [Celeribacter sp. HF31]|uniref:hypothetical protein n=1 Tax=Celeribacter sp. HF31 TaxID=2721558 RepID=UPI001431D191|nr:hypothetical protein [Celeribacter sp. HF31]NIY79934.1 hypothetical protein [Celeribacter sp. HF31]